METAQTQLGRGASPAIALTAMEIAMRNIVGAAHVYNANATSAYREGVTEARLILKVRVHAIHASRLRLVLYFKSMQTFTHACIYLRESRLVITIAIQAEDY